MKNEERIKSPTFAGISPTLVLRDDEETQMGTDLHRNSV